MHMLLVTPWWRRFPSHPIPRASCTYLWRWRSACEDREAALTLTAVSSRGSFGDSDQSAVPGESDGSGSHCTRRSRYPRGSAAGLSVFRADRGNLAGGAFYVLLENERKQTEESRKQQVAREAWSRSAFAKAVAHEACSFSPSRRAVPCRGRYGRPRHRHRGDPRAEGDPPTPISRSAIGSTTWHFPPASAAAAI